MNIKHTKSGMTLIELLISLGVLALAVGLTGGILLSVVKAYQKSSLLTSMKRNGNRIVTVVEDNVRSAQKVECFSRLLVDPTSVTMDDGSSCNITLVDPYDTFGGVLITQNDGKLTELGFMPPSSSSTSCVLGNKTNGYFYSRTFNDVAEFTNAGPVSDIDKVTDDSNSESGVNISPSGYDTFKVFDVVDYSGKQTVTISFLVSNPACNSLVEKSEIFRTSVSPRQKTGSTLN